MEEVLYMTESQAETIIAILQSVIHFQNELIIVGGAIFGVLLALTFWDIYKGATKSDNR